MALRVRTALAALAVTATLGGCGLGSGRRTGGASVLITRGFGSHQVGSLTAAHTPGSETVMRMLERSFHVQTRYGGGFVQAIDGLAGDGTRTDWFYYVNGVQAPQGAATTPVHRGDHIWWDLHDWRATDSIPAVVGSFPEPFVSGLGGKRYPTTLECAGDVGTACKQVTAALDAAHVPVASQLIGTGSGPATLGVVVGTWSEVASQVGASWSPTAPAPAACTRASPDEGQLAAAAEPHRAGGEDARHGRRVDRGHRRQQLGAHLADHRHRRRRRHGGRPCLQRAGAARALRARGAGELPLPVPLQAGR